MAVRALIAYDGSATAGTAVRAAASLFPGAQAIVTSLGEAVVPTPASLTLAVPTIAPAIIQSTIDELRQESRDAAERTAQQGAERARAVGLDPEARAAAGEAGAGTASTLLKFAHELAADVLVCGTRGHGAFTRVLLGSTSTSLLRSADLPLLVVPDGAGELGGPAMVAYDGSEPAQRAIEAGGRLLPGRRTVVVHAWVAQHRHGLMPDAFGQGPSVDVLASLDRALAEAAAATMQDGVERAQAAGLDVVGKSLASGGGVWRTIASAAREQDAAVIITGARGLGGARSALLGSVSSGLLHNADLPVLVVPPESRD